MIRQKLKPGHVAAGSDGRRQHVSGEGAQNGRLRLAPVFNGQEVKLLLHAQVVEGQVDAALGFGDDQPHAVHVVAVLLGVVWRQQDSRWSCEVEETRNCESSKDINKG